MRNYIFIHVPKTGGRSVAAALNVMDIEHKGIQSHIQFYGIGYVANTFKFTIVRNPWDRMWSYFKYFILDKRNDLDRYYYDFNQWIVDGSPVKIGNNINSPPAIGFDHMSFYKDKSNNIQIDYFMKFENLQSDFNNLCSYLNIDLVPLPHIGKDDSLLLIDKYPYIEYDYKRQYTSQEAIDIVYLRNIEIINMFNYDF